MQALAAVLRFLLAHPNVGVVGMLGLLVVVLAALNVCRKRFSLHPELLRKLVHISIGLVTLTFPWIFAEPWPCSRSSRSPARC